MRIFGAAALAAALATASEAAVFDVVGDLSYARASGFELSGELDADLDGLDPDRRTAYRASARLSLPDGLAITPDLSIGPLSLSPTLTLGPGGRTLVSGAVVTPPFRVGALLAAPILPGGASLGGLLTTGFEFLLDNPSGGGTFGRSDQWSYSYDVAGIHVTEETLTGPFRATLNRAGLGARIDEAAARRSDVLLPRLIARLAAERPDGRLVTACVDHPGRCARLLSIDGLAGAHLPYELALRLRPAAVPVPAALPMLAGGLALLGLLARRRA